MWSPFSYQPTKAEKIFFVVVLVVMVLGLSLQMMPPIIDAWKDIWGLVAH